MLPQAAINQKTWAPNPLDGGAGAGFHSILESSQTIEALMYLLVTPRNSFLHLSL